MSTPLATTASPSHPRGRMSSRHLTVIAYIGSMICLGLATLVAVHTMSTVDYQANAMFRTGSIRNDIGEGFVLFGLLMVMATGYFCAGIWHAHRAVQASLAE